MKDLWESGDPYEYFMGRWSRLVGLAFVDWLSVSPEKRWLDIGCGTGALSEVVLNKQNPSELIAIDQSEGFVKAAQQRLGSSTRCEIGNALELSFHDSRFEIETNFKDFDDYWNPFLGGQGPAPTYVLSLTDEDRNRLRDYLHGHLPIREDGSIPMIARAWAAKSII